MPLDTYANQVAAQLTGRTRWSDSKGPQAFAGRDSIDLLGDLMFDTQGLWNRQLIRLERRPLKTSIGFDPERRFFSPAEIMESEQLAAVAGEYGSRRSLDAKARPSKDEQAATDAMNSLSLFMSFANDIPLAIVPAEGEYLRASSIGSDPGAEHIQLALAKLKESWDSQSRGEAISALVMATTSSEGFTEQSQRRVGRELFYNSHGPWKWAAVASGLAILALGLSWVTHWRIAYVLAGLLIAWSVVEQGLGLGLRISILGRAPVSNTYEALLWMGLVALAIGLVAQLMNRRSWYLAGGVATSMIAIIFAMLVPLADQTNTLPAVLRSNYWLIIHVLTIVASYGALMFSAVLGHVYLVRNVLMRKGEGSGESRVIVQVYRLMQLGLVLLTVGTILGGVWAADSWGRFWGWDPKETWSLISIIVYFAMIHARFVGWLRDVGLAVASIVGFIAIIWTFYGVNYVMASGLHSYGFGSGGEIYVAAWAGFELVFVAVCLFVAGPKRPSQPEHGSSDTALQTVTNS
jgi:cytochrome c-type biogenesis protein CcsB